MKKYFVIVISIVFLLGITSCASKNKCRSKKGTKVPMGIL